MEPHPHWVAATPRRGSPRSSRRTAPPWPPCSVSSARASRVQTAKRAGPVELGHRQRARELTSVRTVAATGRRQAQASCPHDQHPAHGVVIHTREGAPYSNLQAQDRRSTTENVPRKEQGTRVESSQATRRGLPLYAQVALGLLILIGIIGVAPATRNNTIPTTCGKSSCGLQLCPTRRPHEGYTEKVRHGGNRDALSPREKGRVLLAAPAYTGPAALSTPNPFSHTQ